MEDTLISQQGGESEHSRMAGPLGTGTGVQMLSIPESVPPTIDSSDTLSAQDCCFILFAHPALTGL